MNFDTVQAGPIVPTQSGWTGQIDVSSIRLYELSARRQRRMTDDRLCIMCYGAFTDTYRLRLPCGN